MKRERKKRQKRKNRRKGHKEKAGVLFVCSVYFFKHPSAMSFFFLISYFG